MIDWKVVAKLLFHERNEFRKGMTAAQRQSFLAESELAIVEHENTALRADIVRLRH